MDMILYKYLLSGVSPLIISVNQVKTGGQSTGEDLLRNLLFSLSLLLPETIS